MPQKRLTQTYASLGDLIQASGAEYAVIDTWRDGYQTIGIMYLPQTEGGLMQVLRDLSADTQDLDLSQVSFCGTPGGVALVMHADVATQEIYTYTAPDSVSYGETVPVYVVDGDPVELTVVRV